MLLVVEGCRISLRYGQLAEIGCCLLYRSVLRLALPCWTEAGLVPVASPKRDPRALSLLCVVGKEPDLELSVRLRVVP